MSIRFIAEYLSAAVVSCVVSLTNVLASRCLQGMIEMVPDLDTGLFIRERAPSEQVRLDSHNANQPFSSFQHKLLTAYEQQRPCASSVHACRP